MKQIAVTTSAAILTAEVAHVGIELKAAISVIQHGFRNRMMISSLLKITFKSHVAGNDS